MRKGWWAVMATCGVGLAIVFWGALIQEWISPWASLLLAISFSILSWWLWKKALSNDSKPAKEATVIPEETNRGELIEQHDAAALPKRDPVEAPKEIQSRMLKFVDKSLPNRRVDSGTFFGVEEFLGDTPPEIADSLLYLVDSRYVLAEQIGWDQANNIPFFRIYLVTEKGKNALRDSSL